MYGRFQKRAAERLQFMLDTLDQGIEKLDFGNDQTLETKRDTIPWAKTTAELDDLWRKRLIAAALSLRLAGKSDADLISFILQY